MRHAGMNSMGFGWLKRAFCKRGFHMGLLLAGAVFVLAACQRSPDEAALRAQMEALQSAIVARDASKVAGLLSDEFIGPGSMDRTEARRMAAGLFLRYRQVGLRTGPLSVELHDSRRATVRFTATATGGSGGLLPEQGSVQEVVTGWRVEGGDWRLVSAQWTPKL